MEALDYPTVCWWWSVLGYLQHHAKGVYGHPGSCIHHSSSTMKIWPSSPHLPQKVCWN